MAYSSPSTAAPVPSPTAPDQTSSPSSPSLNPSGPTKRERFLKSIGIPSFQSSSTHKSPTNTSNSASLPSPRLPAAPQEQQQNKDDDNGIPREKEHYAPAMTSPLPSTGQTPLDPKSSKGGMTLDKDNGVENHTADPLEDKGQGTLRARLGKRGSTIRLRTYRSIGNLNTRSSSAKNIFEAAAAHPIPVLDVNMGKGEIVKQGISTSRSAPADLAMIVKEGKMDEGEVREEMGKGKGRETSAPNSWMISVAAESRSSIDGLTDAPREGPAVVIHVNASNRQETLGRSYIDIAKLHDGLLEWQRTHGHQDDLHLPELPSAIRQEVPVKNRSLTFSNTSTTSNATSPSSKQSNLSKYRRGSFLANMQNKVKSTIRAVSESGKNRDGSANNGATSPTSMASRTSSPGPISPGLTPSASMSQSLSMELGKFDFEKNGQLKEEDEEVVEVSARNANKRSDSIASSGAAPKDGLSLDKAAGLVAAMSVDPQFATKASRHSSQVISSGGLYGKPPPMTLGSSPSLPPLSLPSATLEMDAPGLLPSPRRAAPTEAEKDVVKALSVYLNHLAGQSSVRNSAPWKRFFFVRSDDLSTRTADKAWSPVDEQGMKEEEGAPGDISLSAQRKKLLRRSRSMGEELTSLFAGVDAEKRGKTDALSKSGDGRRKTTVEHSPKNTKHLKEDAIPLASGVDSSADYLKPKDLADVSPRSSADDGTGATATTSEIHTPRTASESVTDGEYLSTGVDSEQDPMSASVSPGLPGDIMPRRKRRGRKPVTVDDFELIRVLGKGCAGKVVLVKHNKSGGLFAMKAIVKRHVLAHQELTHTLTEQSVLKRMSADDSRNPFIVKLWWSFHDVDNLYLVLDFLPGGDLATQLSRWGRLGRDRARFYTCEIVEGVEALHAAGVIYRDLKPENVLLNSDGHVSLADFGLAAEFPNSHGPLAAIPPWMGGSAAKTDDGRPKLARHASATVDPSASASRDTATSFVGTAEYLAPEVIKGQPYSYEVDWWALGTMLYEALIGNTPFWVENHADMYMRVVHEELRFPEDRALDKDTKSFIRGLLQKNPAFRLCEPRIRKHPYLGMIDWDHVKHKRYIPPYIPPNDSTLEYDVQNFDKNFLEMDPQLKGDQSSTSGESDSSDDGEKPSLQVEYDENVFDAYQYKHRDIVSMIDIDETDLEGTGPVDRVKSREGGDIGGEGETSDSTRATSAESGAGDEATPSRSRPIKKDAEMEDEGRPTLATRPSVEAQHAIMQRIQTLASEGKNIKTSRHSREIINRSSTDRLSKIFDPECGQFLNLSTTGAEEDEWDMVDDAPDAGDTYANGNGRETFFARGVVDKYRLAVLKRKESTVRKKPSSRFKRSPASSVILGTPPRGGEDIPPLPQTPKRMGLKNRLRSKIKTPQIGQSRSTSPSKQDADRSKSPVKKASVETTSTGNTAQPALLAAENRGGSGESVKSGSMRSGWSTENGSVNQDRKSSVAGSTKGSG